MEYFTLPQTDLKVSRLILGQMRIADKSEEEVEELIDKALELGINFFDHADIYGGGKSESLFGAYLKKHPEKRKDMIIQTKCGIVPGKRYDFSKEHIINSVNESLKRLNTDYVDILLLHRPDVLCDPKEVAEAFDELYESKKVKYFGVSNHTPYQIELLNKYCKHKIIINQLQLSIVHTPMIDADLNMNMTYEYAQEKSQGVLNYCRLNNITIQAWSVLQASWEEGTFMNNSDYEKLNNLLVTLSNKYNVSPSAIAIAWILRHPANIMPVVGTSSSLHLEELYEAVNINLDRQEWYDLYLSTGKPLP